MHFGTWWKWLADMQVLLSEMQKNCSKCKVFASRAAKPACRPQFSLVGRTSRAAKPACRPAIFTGRPDRLLYLLFYYFDRFHEVPGSRVLHLGLPIAHVRRSLASPRVFLQVGRPTLHVGSRSSRAANPACLLTCFACRVANPTRPPHPSISQSFFCISDRHRLTFLHVEQTHPFWQHLHLLPSLARST